MCVCVWVLGPSFRTISLRVRKLQAFTTLHPVQSRCYGIGFRVEAVQVPPLSGLTHSGSVLSQAEESKKCGVMREGSKNPEPKTFNLSKVFQT